MKINKNYKKTLAVLSADFVLTLCGLVKSEIKTNNTKIVSINKKKNETVTSGAITSKKKEVVTEHINENFYLKEDTDLKDANNNNIIIKAKKYDMGHTRKHL